MNSSETVVSELVHLKIEIKLELQKIK